MAVHSKTPDSRARVAAILQQPAWVAAVAFAVALAFALLAWWHINGRIRQEAHLRFEQRTGQLTAALQRELGAYANTLRGADGLLVTATTPDENGWRDYVSRLDLDDTMPALRALGYARLGEGGGAALAASAAQGARALVRQRQAAVTASAPDTPLTSSFSPLAPISLTAPASAEALPLNADLAADGARRAALLRAADSGGPILAPQAEAPGGPALADRSQMELYLPVYRSPSLPASVQARRANLAGFLVAAIDPQRLFDGIAMQERRIDMRISAGTPAVLLYASDNAGEDAPDPAARLQRRDTLNIGGAPFTLEYTTSERLFDMAANAGAAALLIAGVLGALLFAASAFLLARRRAEAADLSGPAYARSSLNEARMMGIIRSSMEAIITIDESQRIVIFNPMSEKVFGCSAMEAIGSPLSRFIPERFRAAHARYVEQFGVTGVSERQMGHQRVLSGLRASGEEFPIEASISQIHDGTAKLYTVMLRDVTERVRADNALKQSREELRELSANLQNVREEEKTRIARELHDDLGQQLTALKMDLSAVERTLDGEGSARPDHPALAGQLRGMRRLIDATVASVRRIAADLRPVMLDDLGLIPAIEWLASDFTHRYGIEVDRRLGPVDAGFTRNGATTLFRIVQEALTNVARHADATRVTLTIHTTDSHCMLRIADNGRGTDAAGTRREKSFGLLGIRERAHMLGGTVEIETAAGQGFSMTVTFPLEAVQREEAQP